jgi:hypothetical protein
VAEPFTMRQIPTESDSEVAEFRFACNGLVEPTEMVASGNGQVAAVNCGK